MLTQIATIIISLSDTFKIVKDLIDLVSKMMIEREMRKIDDKATARKKAIKHIMDGVRGAKDVETRLYLADLMFKLSNDRVE